jgi:hypothetical protein
MGSNRTKLFKDINLDDIVFKPIRKTATGSRIIDIENDNSYQTCWLKILYPVEYSIAVDCEKIKDILNEIDEKIIEHSSNVLDFPKNEILKMYRCLKKSGSNNGFGETSIFSVSLLTNTIMFDKDRNFYDKSEIKSILKPGQYVRFIFKFKKVYFKDHELTCPLELIQIELA